MMWQALKRLTKSQGFSYIYIYRERERERKRERERDNNDEFEFKLDLLERESVGLDPRLSFAFAFFSSFFFFFFFFSCCTRFRGDKIHYLRIV